MAKEMTQQERRQEAIRSVQEQFDARPPRGAGCGCTVEEVWLPMSDGVRLYTQVWRPDCEGPVRVLMRRS